MTAAQILRLYPRAWRERYGEEFLAIVGDDRLRPQQVIDIFSGALDAWLSSDVRNATTVGSTTMHGGRPMTLKSMIACQRTAPRATTRDGLIGAGVMIAISLLFMAARVAARQRGWTETGDTLAALGFPVSFSLSMPFWLLKGQPRKAQVFIVGTTLAIYIVSAFLAAKF